MTPDYGNRRRAAVAAAITALAVPSLFLLDTGGDESAEPAVGTVVGSVVSGDGTTSGSDSAVGADRPTVTDAMGTTPVAFLEVQNTAPAQEPATIAIPRIPDSIAGTATFGRSIRSITSCQVSATVGAPFGVAITITNLDNSRSVQCLNDVGGDEPDHSVVLHPDAFAQIGDLTDAPVPIQIIW